MLAKLLIAAIAAMTPTLSAACMVTLPPTFEDILMADVVVAGTVLDYKIVDAGTIGDLEDYARFTIQITEIYEGEVSEGQLSFTWGNSTFGGPDAFPKYKAFIFALRDATAPPLPLRGLSGTLVPAPDSERLTVLQAPCADAFIFEQTGPVGRAVEMIFDGKGDQRIEAYILAQYLRMTGE